MQPAEEWQLRQRSIAAATLALVLQLWTGIRWEEPQRSFAQLLPRLLGAVVTAQLSASSGAPAYVARVLQAAGHSPAPTPVVPRRSLAGRTADGREWPGALAQPMVHTLGLRLAGTPPEPAAAAGAERLARLVSTEVLDAGRIAVGVECALQPQVVGYVRQVRLPACGRCLVLAGRIYRVSDFARHPRCDCQMVPTTSLEAPATAPAPHDLFERMSPGEQDAALGPAVARLARDGGDLGQLVNARRGMQRLGEHWTTEATTRRRAVRRLSPAGVVAQYGDNPEEFAAAMLRHGYL